MTARSFTEAFAQTAGPLDLDSIESDVRQQAYYDDELLALVVEARDLRDSRERAIRWAVTLEGQTASVDRVLGEIEDGEHATTGRQFGQGMAHAAKLIRAALTGSTE